MICFECGCYGHVKGKFPYVHNSNMANNSRKSTTSSTSDVDAASNVIEVNDDMQGM